MNKLIAKLLPAVALVCLGACGKQETAPAPSAASTPPAAEAPAAPAAEPGTAPAEAEQTAPAAASETVSETDEPPQAEAQTSSAVQPALRLGGPATTATTSARFKEGTHYKKIVPAQPTGVAPGKVEVVEVFWYGCGHCFALDPAVESWRSRAKAPYVEFLRLPAMWNDTTRMHARVFYTAELLGKLEALHPLIFRQIHVNSDPLNTVEKISAFFKQHGVSNEDFNKAFSSFAVESKLQRADFLNRRYRIQSVPTVVVNGKYTTSVSEAGNEQDLFALIDELATNEHGG
jgi:protein dithiol oxidoreductase (disulfide-forming)